MTKRVIIATIFGIAFGFVCWGFAASGPDPVPWSLAVTIILSRTLIGFAIGISILKWAWWLHGIIMGVIFSLPMAFSIFMSDKPEAAQYFWATIVMGLIYGFLIELFTSIVFKAKVAE